MDDTLSMTQTMIPMNLKYGRSTKESQIRSPSYYITYYDLQTSSDNHKFRSQSQIIENWNLRNKLTTKEI